MNLIIDTDIEKSSKDDARSISNVQILSMHFSTQQNRCADIETGWERGKRQPKIVLPLSNIKLKNTNIISQK